MEVLLLSESISRRVRKEGQISYSVPLQLPHYQPGLKSEESEQIKRQESRACPNKVIPPNLIITLTAYVILGFLVSSLESTPLIYQLVFLDL